MVVLGSSHRRQYISADTTQSFANRYLNSKEFMSNMENNTSDATEAKQVKQTLFDDTKIEIYEVKRHRGRGRTRLHAKNAHHHRVHPRRSLSQGATPRSKHPFIRQPLAPQRRLSVSNLKLNNNYSTEQKLTLVCLSIVSFTSMLAMALIAPFFPLEASKKGMRETVYGFVFSVYALVIMIMSPIAGKLIPIIGPKFMLISGIFVAGVANILFGLLDNINDLNTFTAYCFLVRTFEALGAAAFSTASYTIIMQVFPDNIGTAFGFIETCVGLGMSLGPAIGGGLYGVGGYALPFFVLGAIMLINIPICQYIIKPIDLITPIEKNSNDSYWKLITIPQVLVVGIVVVLVSQTISFLDPTVEPHFREMNISPEYVSIVFLLLSATYTISSPIVGWFSGYFDNKFPIMALGMFLTCDGLLLMGPSFLIPLDPSILLSVASMALIGIAYALAFIPTFESILDIALDKGFSDSVSTYSLVSGLWSSMYSLGEVTGPSLGGWLSENFDFSIASTIMAGFALLGAIVAGITCFFVQPEGSESSSSSSSSSSESEYERSISSKSRSARTSRRGSQWETDLMLMNNGDEEEEEKELEKEPLLNGFARHGSNYTLNNNGIFKDKEKELIFSVASI